MTDPNRGDRWAISTAFLVALALYWRTAAPGLVIEGDCGELVAAARVAGIPHAPGYPTYMSLASLLGLLCAPENLARVLNLTSAFFGALTVALVAAVTLRTTRRLRPDAPGFDHRAAALLAGLALATSVEFWTQSMSAEVYTLGSALVVACLVLVLPRADVPHPNLRRIHIAALAAGLAFGVHYTVGPVCALIVGIAFLCSGAARSLAGAARALLAFALGLTTFAYLPLRSAADPLLDSADPETLRGFLRAIFLLGRPSSGASLGDGLSNAASLGPEFLARLAGQWPLWISALAALGAVALGRRTTRGVLLQLGAVFGAISIGSVLMAGFEPSDELVYEVRFLFLPAHAVACVAAGVGALVVSGLAHARPGLGRVLSRGLWLGSALGIGVWGIAEFDRQDKSGDRIAIEYAEALLDDAPASSIVLTFGDNAWMVLTYMQVVEARRPDVTLVHVPLLVRGWYRRQLARAHPGLRVPQHVDPLAELVRTNADAPLFTADPIARDIPGFESVPVGMLMRLVPNGVRTEPPALRPARDFDGRHIERDLRERTLLLYRANSYLVAGDWYMRARDPLRAAEAYSIGASLPDPSPLFADWTSLRAMLVLGLARSQLERGLRSQTIDALRRVIELVPDSHESRAARRILSELGAAE